MDKIKSIDSETWYKIFAALALLIFIDAVVLKQLKVPFFGAAILYPVLDSIFVEKTAISMLGLYATSWMIFGVMALAIKPKKK